jgi:hypothetical protein
MSEAKYRDRRYMHEAREAQRAVAEEKAVTRLQEKWQRNNQLYDAGVRRHSNASGKPFDPVTNYTESSRRAMEFAAQEQQQKLKNLVRANLMEERSNQRFNVINGTQRPSVEDLVPPTLKGVFASRVELVEQHYRLRPPRDPALASSVAPSLSITHYHAQALPRPF